MSQYLPEADSQDIHTTSNHSRTENHLQLHSHSCPSLIFTLSGKGYITVGDQNHPLVPNSCWLLEPGVKHKMDQAKALSLIVLYFGKNAPLQSWADIEEQLPWQKACPVNGYSKRLIKFLLRALLHEQNNKGTWQLEAQRIYLSQLLLVLIRDMKYQSPVRQVGSHGRVVEFLQDMASQYHLQINLPEAAKTVGLSQRQFSNLCKKITGRSYIQFINRRRCEIALNLLKTSAISISSLAFEVGFEDISTFYRAFKKQFGHSPKHFR